MLLTSSDTCALCGTSGTICSGPASSGTLCAAALKLTEELTPLAGLGRKLG